MGEPLKDKGLMKKSLILSYWKDGDSLYPEEDVKSAVEWLKEWTKNNLSGGQKKFTLEAIDKAFEDVIKK